jgi:hypothetical protein
LLKRRHFAEELAMKVYAVEPDTHTGLLLAGAQFSDAFSVTVNDATFNARQAAERMLGHSPRWIEALTTLRDHLVKPFGLKTSSSTNTLADTIRIFPVLSETPDRLVAGFNDNHLDFRIIVDVTPSDQGRRVTATTLVLTHNLLGKVYLAIILPFHRLVVRSMLRQVAA